MDAGYDYEPIYQEARKSKSQAITAYNRKREREMEGFDAHLHPPAFGSMLTAMKATMLAMKH
jgi:hypothetical protein